MQKLYRMGEGRTLVKNARPSNVINLKKNICIMTILMGFSISESQNQANKNTTTIPPTTPNTNDFGRAVNMKKYCLKQTRGKIWLQIQCYCQFPSHSPLYLLRCVPYASIKASIYMFYSLPGFLNS